MKLTTESFVKLAEATGEDEWSSLFIRVEQDEQGNLVVLPPLEDLTQTDLRDGQYVQVEATEMVDDVALDAMSPEVYDAMDPADWPVMDAYRITEIGRALPGYVSGEEYFPSLEQLIEYLGESKGMGATIGSNNWFALVFAQEEV